MIYVLISRVSFAVWRATHVVNWHLKMAAFFDSRLEGKKLRLTGNGNNGCLAVWRAIGPRLEGKYTV